MKKGLLILFNFFLFSCSVPTIVILEDPLTSQEHVNLGYIYEKQGKLELAEKEYKKAIKKDKKNWIAYYNLGNLYAKKEDMLKQIRFIKNMGPLDKLLGMLPGIGAQLKGLKIDEKKFKKTEAIILSMTKQERRNPKIINLSRKQRIAKGSGTTVSDVNKVLKEYEEMKKMIKKLKGMQGIPQLPKFPFPFKR